MKLANKQLPQASYLVAKCYIDGIGTDRDLFEAKKWFNNHTLIKPKIILDDFLNDSNINY